MRIRSLNKWTSRAYSFASNIITVTNKREKRVSDRKTKNWCSTRGKGCCRQRSVQVYDHASSSHKVSRKREQWIEAGRESETISLRISVKLPKASLRKKYITGFFSPVNIETISSSNKHKKEPPLFIKALRHDVY